MADVVVVGSCVVYYVSYSLSLPRPNETLIVTRVLKGWGGKGANQCVKAAHLGATTTLVARLGEDILGQEYITALRNEGVNTEFVFITLGHHTGLGQVIVADNGENQIVVVPGANLQLSRKDVIAAADAIQSAKVLLVQADAPLEMTLEALHLAKGKAIRIVNAAPAIQNPDPRLFTESDIFCVSGTEAQQMSGIPVNTIGNAFRAAEQFLGFGCKMIVITLGVDGAVFTSQDMPVPKHVPTNIVQDSDFVGADDCFMGAMAFYLAYYSSLPMEEVVRRSWHTAMMSALSFGTQPWPDGRSDSNVSMEEDHEVQDSPSKPIPCLPEPMFLKHQLVGDSLLLRFAKQILFHRYHYENGLQFLGLCVSGQTIRELKNRVKNKFSPIAKRIILLIGTNDMKKDAEVEDMITDMEVLMSHLLNNTQKTVVLTLPPVPKLENKASYRERFTEYNRFLKSLHDGENVFVINITDLFLNEDGGSKLECYKRFYDRQQKRPDLIHLNRKGLLTICNFLRLHPVINREL